jgi:transcriptional/translational regulatory protein YebC/TACO1
MQAQLEPAQAEITILPATYTHLEGEAAEKMEKLIDMLEDLDDVQNVYSNAN